MLMMVKSGKRNLSAKVLYRLEQVERAAGIQVPEITPTEAQNRLKNATGEDLEFWKNQQCSRLLKTLRDQLADAVQTLDLIIPFLSTPSVPINKTRKKSENKELQTP